MRIERRTSGDLTVLTFNGEFDVFNLRAVTEKLDALLDSGARKLIFNMKKLRRVNSSALGYMLKVRKRLVQNGGDLVVSEPSEHLATAMSTLGIDQVLPIFSGDDAARDYFRRGGRAAANPVPPPAPVRDLEETARD